VEEKGTLYLCATPIGNLEDITLRVLRILREADLIAAEDTRRTRKLLSHYDIHTPMTSYHEHNCRSKGEYLLQLLAEGQQIALVTDAGTPGISDPGAELAAKALARRFTVTALPGASAAVTALAVSGLPIETFVFEGFLPSSSKARRDKLNALRGEKRTLVFYEAPHRILKVLEDMSDIWGNRRLAVARELTKKHEEVIRGTVDEALDYFRHNTPRGEFCLVLEGYSGGMVREEDSLQQLDLPKLPGLPGLPGSLNPSPGLQALELEESGVPRKEALRTVAKAYGLSRREVYRIMVLEKEKLRN